MEHSPNVGKVTIRLFDKDDKVLLENTADYSDGIAPDSGGPFNIDTLVKRRDLSLNITTER